MRGEKGEPTHRAVVFGEEGIDRGATCGAPAEIVSSGGRGRPPAQNSGVADDAAPARRRGPQLPKFSAQRMRRNARPLESGWRVAGDSFRPARRRCYGQKLALHPVGAVEGFEARVLLGEKELDGIGRAVALLGDEELGLVLKVGIVAVVILGAVNEGDDVGVLLDGAGLAQVAELRLGVFAAAAFGSTAELGEGANSD